ncbi:MAG: class I SAM-dependent methyltransferase, partial [Nitrospiraceae bacterium]
AVADQFIEGRPRSNVGVATVHAWARSLPQGGSILDLGCGSGVPISQVFIDIGFAVHGVDASPSMVAAFRSRFPNAQVVCEAVEESSLFDRTFDGAVAWGLMFLLPTEMQRDLIHRVAGVIRQGGRFLFTAPAQVCTWNDLLTGRTSLSLGAEAYKAILADAELALARE